MLDGSNTHCEGETIPFVHKFYGHHRRTPGHSIPEGEGGKQEDPLIPLLFLLGQHGALKASQE